MPRTASHRNRQPATKAQPTKKEPRNSKPLRGPSNRIRQAVTIIGIDAATPSPMVCFVARQRPAQTPEPKAAKINDLHRRSESNAKLASKPEAVPQRMAS